MKADEWNEKYPEGTKVILTDDFSDEYETTTRSIAWELGHGESVIKVEGRTGGYMLQRIRPAIEESNK